MILRCIIKLESINIYMLEPFLFYMLQPRPTPQALKEITTFVQQQQQANGIAITEEDVQDVREAGRALLASVDDFLALAPPDDRRLVENLVKESSLNR